MTKDTTTRLSLTEHIHNELGFSKTECSEILDNIFTEINESIAKEGEFRILRFGTFKVRAKKKRVGRNPKTKQTALISARNVVSFVASDLLKKKINEENT